jgi:hypothetical protein
MVSFPLYFGLEMRQNIMAPGAYVGGCSPHDAQEAEKTNRKGPGPRYIFKDMPPVSYFLQVGLPFRSSTTSQYSIQTFESTND